MPDSFVIFHMILESQTASIAHGTKGRFSKIKIRKALLSSFYWKSSMKFMRVIITLHSSILFRRLFGEKLSDIFIIYNNTFKTSTIATNFPIVKKHFLPRYVNNYRMLMPPKNKTPAA